MILGSSGSLRLPSRTELYTNIRDTTGQALGEAADAVNQAFPEAAKKARDLVDGAKEFGEGAKSFADGVRDAVLG